ncbi:MAG: MFS transporter [Halioglobus sp.]|nr:MFS transporter [Halioglobus sp.]
MGRLSPLEKWSYAVGNMPYAVKDAAFINFVIFYYTQVQGLSGTLAGLAAFIAMSWDAITDPIVGSWSDTIRSRWGRRHPPILLGGLPFAALFVVLFAPPADLGETGLFVWFTLAAMALRTFLTIYFIPYSAMGAELSTDYDERTVIAKARVTMAWVAGMLLPALAFAFIFQGDGDSDGRLIAANYTTYGFFSAAIAAVTLLFCVWGTRTVIARLPTASDKEPGFGLRKAIADLRTALGNHNFRVSVGAKLAFGMAAGVYTTLALYMGTYFWEFSSEQLAGLVVPYAFGTLLAFSVIARLGTRHDKATLFGAASLVIAVNTFWFIGLRLFDLLPGNGHPLIYPLQWVNTVIAVFAVASVQILGISLLADILDEHEVATGRRQEGVFFAASTFVLKATSGVGSLVAGLVIDAAGIQSGSQPGEISAQSLAALGWFNIVIICLLAMVAFLFARRICLSREDHREIRRTLDARAASM